MCKYRRYDRILKLIEKSRFGVMIAMSSPKIHNEKVTTVAYPGFSQGGGANSPGGGTNIRFCQIFPKTA